MGTLEPSEIEGLWAWFSLVRLLPLGPAGRPRDLTAHDLIAHYRTTRDRTVCDPKGMYSAHTWYAHFPACPFFSTVPLTCGIARRASRPGVHTRYAHCTYPVCALYIPGVRAVHTLREGHVVVAGPGQAPS